MRKPKFTPGPWYVDEYADAAFICSDDWQIAEMMPKETASAYLIAAAPDLYAALERVLSKMQEMAARSDLISDDEALAMNEARAALARARGEP